ncbi:MAG: DUF1569 domain-containing protein [Chitinophagales bacterium]|nr:DUF1569 domain-containing protein [Chitinophagales bacterium]
MAEDILNMDINFEDYFNQTAIDIINKIEGNEQADWGIMTAHHMIEHLQLVFQFVLPEHEMPILLSGEKLERQRNFLYSELPLMKNFKPPFLPKEELLPLKTNTIDEAKEALISTIHLFLSTIQATDFTTANHPFFGKLNTKEWMLFQYKHTIHHFKQFNLI